MEKIISKINSLNDRREKLQETLFHSPQMLRGSLYEMKRSCGKLNCRCQRGEKHAGMYLSTKVDGKTKVRYVRKKDRPWVMGKLIDFRRFKKRMAEINQLNGEIMELLKQLRDSKLITYK